MLQLEILRPGIVGAERQPFRQGEVVDATDWRPANVQRLINQGKVRVVLNAPAGLDPVTAERTRSHRHGREVPNG